MLQLRERPCDVGEQPWPLGRGRGAEKLDRCRELRMSVVDRRDRAGPADAAESVAVMIRWIATIEATTSAAICPLMPLRLRKPISFMISRRSTASALQPAA